jgi:uncharacterized ion transporter superfamily protein YfcC
MFGVLQETEAVTRGIDRLVSATGGNANVVVPVFMVAIACGSTFLGLISEYLVIVPIAIVLAERLGRDALFGLAMVTVAAKIGYLTSVTNPLALAVAQPLVGVEPLSGAAFRATTFVVFLAIGVIFVLRRKTDSAVPVASTPHSSVPPAEPVTPRHVLVLVTLAAAIAAMIVGVQRAHWGSGELSAMYLGLALAIAIVGGVGSRAASQAFVKGMQGMVLAALLVGLAGAVEVILTNGAILDTIINTLTRSVEGKHPVIVANIMMALQMLIDVLIPSTSGKAAVTMPILGPIGHLSGVSGQVTVQAFLFGNGLMNTLTPTSGMLLAYLATGKVAYARWIRYVLPLALVLLALCVVALSAAVVAGF